MPSLSPIKYACGLFILSCLLVLYFCGKHVRNRGGELMEVSAKNVDLILLLTRGLCTLSLFLQLHAGAQKEF
jgi:hypothetical protein